MSTAQFIGIGILPTALTIESFTQNSGEWGDSYLVTYNDNVQSQNTYYYLSEAMIAAYDLDPKVYIPGWYFCDEESMPDTEKGVQKASLPYAQGCVIVGSAMDGVSLTSAGEVSTDYYEIVIPSGSRKMTGNTLPRTIDINEVQQIGGEWGDSYLVTYNDNVQSQNTYYYLSASMIAAYDLDPEAYKPGWYFCDEESMPDVTKGVQKVSFAPGQGFVIVGSAMDGVTIRFPKAIPDAE